MTQCGCRVIEPDLRRLRRQHPGISISFNTINAPQRLEADQVIILGADNARMGFPSMILDDPLLSLARPEAEPFANAEERRVMYVAMTRARKTVTISTSEARPSSFVTELMKDSAYDVANPREAAERTQLPAMWRAAALHARTRWARLVSMRTH